MKIIDRIGKYKTGDWHERKLSDIRYITIHHTAIKSNETDEQLLKDIQTLHESKEWAGLAFHYVITKSGKTYQINDQKDIVWHDRVNRDSIGIALDGYFHEPHNEIPTKSQLKSLKNLLYELRKDLAVQSKNIIGHRKRSSTNCPGNNLYKYIQEYQKEGNSVSWGHIDNTMKDISTMFNYKETIPLEWAESLKLTEKDWFNNKWTFEKFFGNINDWYETTVTQTKGLENKTHEIKILKETNNDIQKHINVLQNIIRNKNKIIQDKNQSLLDLEKGISERTSFIHIFKICIKKVKGLIRTIGARGGI